MKARTSGFRSEMTPEVFNGRSVGHLPGLAGLRIPLRPDGPLAQVDKAGAFVLE